MVHLLRSLIAGYFLALLAGFVATLAGVSAFSVIMGIWVGGSLLSVALAACFARYAYTQEERHATPVPAQEPTRPVRRDLTAKELAMWDQDLAAECFEADYCYDEGQQANKSPEDRKTG